MRSWHSTDSIFAYEVKIVMLVGAGFKPALFRHTRSREIVQVIRQRAGWIIRNVMADAIERFRITARLLHQGGFETRPCGDNRNLPVPSRPRRHTAVTNGV
jgi:hypothetical protein